MELKVQYPNILLGGINGLSDEYINQQFGDLKLYPTVTSFGNIVGLLKAKPKQSIFRSGVDYTDPGEVALMIAQNKHDLYNIEGTNPIAFPRDRHLIEDQDGAIYHPVLFGQYIGEGKVDLDAVDHLHFNTLARPDLYVPEAQNASALLADIGKWAEGL